MSVRAKVCGRFGCHEKNKNLPERFITPATDRPQNC